MEAEQRADFCARLKAVRERSGRSLDEIAASTKVSASIFRAFERNDLSRWPKGIFGRSFLRDYLRAIGQDPEPFVEEFVRLFPQGANLYSDTSSARASTPGAARLSMTLAVEPRDRVASAAGRCLAAGLDILGIAVATGLVLALTGISIWAAAVVATIGYFSLGTALVGRSFATWWTCERESVRWRHESRPGTAPRWLRAMAARADGPSASDSKAPYGAESSLHLTFE